MILMSAIANITSNLDVIRQQDGKAISSHSKLKEEALSCLKKLIDQAPINEYKNMIESKDSDILLGYLMSVLCHLAKNDKSRLVRLNSLEVMNILIKRLGFHHSHGYSVNKCAITSLVLAVPGVSSTLFKVVMSDTKLNHKILVVAVKTLSSLIEVCFLNCNHVINSGDNRTTKIVATKLEGDYLKETCDNLATRIKILLEYMMNNSLDIHSEVRLEMLEFLKTLVSCHTEILKRLIHPLIRYIANMKSGITSFGSKDKQARESIDSLVEAMKNQLKSTPDQDSSYMDLDMSMLDCLFKILDNLDGNALQMLLSERQAELAALNGTFEIINTDAFMAFLEVPNRRKQCINIMTELTEFDTKHSLLFLTDTQIGDLALESRTERVYTAEKRFAHLTDQEITIINNCCQIVGQKCSWLMLVDMLRNEIVDFTNPSKLYLAYHILRGLFERPSDHTNIHIFAKQMLRLYLVKVQEEVPAINSCANDILSSDIIKIVISIETLALIVELYIRYIPKEHATSNIIILKDLLCPLLNWCSSESRAISEASLGSLTKIGQLYGHTTSKDFIKQFTDYIVDGVTQMLDNFDCNPEVTNVLAITFRLASIEVFYYFRDVYERIFKLLDAYHYTYRSKSIALLFYRTLSTLSEWKDANGQLSSDIMVPLTTESSVESVIKDISISLRVEKLRRDRMKAKELRLKMEAMQMSEQDEKNVHEQLENSSAPIEPVDEKDVVDDKNKKKPDDILLTEKILKHCVGLMSSKYNETKILALKTAACGFKILQDDEDTLLPLVHQMWSPLISRLAGNYNQNLEVNLCAFECLVMMAFCSKDFIKRRTLDNIIPQICLFLESQANQSKGKREYEPYCMTMSYKCQLRLLKSLGPLAYNIQLGYSNLWRVINVAIDYLDQSQVSSLREAARTSLQFMIALDADCVWYYAKLTNHLNELPFELIYESF